MIHQLALLAALALRTDAPPLTANAARAMTPSALGDALLAPGHPPVVQATVGPLANGPPPPPGTPYAMPITLWLTARPSRRIGFCEKLQVTVTLAPVMPAAFAPAAARPETLATETLYRWAGRDGAEPPSCEGDRSAFFAVADPLGERAFTIVARLAAAKRQAAAGAMLPFPVSVEDHEGQSWRDFARDHPGAPFPDAGLTRIYTDGATALAAVPLGHVHWIGPWTHSDVLLGSPDLTSFAGHPLESVSLYTGGEWSVGLMLDGDRIVRAKIVRKMPAPF